MGGILRRSSGFLARAPPTTSALLPQTTARPSRSGGSREPGVPRPTRFALGSAAFAPSGAPTGAGNARRVVGAAAAANMALECANSFRGAIEADRLGDAQIAPAARSAAMRDAS
jgi:hypothetical protein